MSRGHATVRTFIRLNVVPLFLVGCAIVTWGLISFDLKRTHDWNLLHANERLKSLTAVYADEVLRSLEGINYALYDLREQWRDNPEEFAELVRTQQARLDPNVAFNVSIADRDGAILFSSMHWDAGPVKIGDRDYFLFHARAQEDELHVSAPKLLREGVRWAIQFTRALPREGGRFNGIISISVAPEYFYRSYQNFALGDDGSMALVHVDGPLIARYPDSGMVMGQTLKNAPWLNAAPRESGFFRKQSEVDQIERLFAWRTLEEGELAVVIGQSTERILAPYHSQQRASMWWGGAATLFFLGAAYFAGWYRQQRDKSAASMQRMEQALAHSHKLESIGKLTGGVAHDFNNILQIIRSNVQLLEMTGKSSKTIDPHLKDISDAVERGSRLASQLLTFARKQKLHPSPIKLNRLLKNIDILIQRLVGPEIEVKIETDGEVWNICADPTLLENVIFNLATNARDAMKGRGVLTFSLKNEVLNPLDVEAYPGMTPGEYVALSISDTGSGMSSEVMERIFEPFFTTKPEGKGTGLGLSMVYGFIKESGGHIHIDSAVGVGTTVCIFMPRSLEEEAVAPSDAAPSPKGGTETVLVVEDNATLRNMSAMMLEQLGYRALKAPNATAALEIIESGCVFDVLMTDVIMPGGVNGVELARRVRAMYPDLTIVLASGDYENLESIQGMCSELNDIYFLPKPFSIHDIDAIIHQSRTRRQVPTYSNSSL